MFALGELIGIDYLYSQSGKPLRAATEETRQDEDETGDMHVDEGFVEEEEEDEFEDLTVNLVTSFLPDQPTQLPEARRAAFDIMQLNRPSRSCKLNR